MVWGVDLVHMVRVGGGIKKARGSLNLEICIFDTIIAVRRGQGKGLRDWGR